MPAKKVKTPLGRGKNLEDALAKIRKDRELRIGSLDELLEDVEVISTGNLAIDYATGIGGLPRGRLCELFGLPSSGKTTCALQVAAQAQKAGGTVAYFDFEHSLDIDYCVALGLAPMAKSFLLAQPETFEQGMNSLRELIETGEITVVVVDSVGSMEIEKELQIETGGSTFADKAKLMAQAMRQLTPSVAKHDTCVIFLNHVYDVIDASPMGQRLSAQGVKRTNTPGGRALKFHASMRIEFTAIGNLRGRVLNRLTNEEEEVPIQTTTAVKVVKNKLAPPYRSAVTRIRYGKGFSQAYSALNVLTAWGLIKKRSGGLFTIPAELTPHGEEVAIKGEETLIRAIEGAPVWEALLAEAAREVLGRTPEPEQTPAPDEEQEIDPEMLAALDA